ncbi:terminase (plasmid) [Pseudonocardia broussonetiae]|uniref:Terminase n=2 Tax=Pseudonocardia broussonetiae TaxID=2736640 RepID=A0A6M6JUT2_9PSEU|nr:terminase [Pseudonocardia broussonetiae]
MGSTTPREWTRPLVTGPPGPCGCGCALSPETSRGFEAVAFATDVVGVKLIPYQRWLLIHLLELLPSGRFRFARVLILISRQAGKTFLLKILALYFLFMGHGQLVLGAAQSLDIAREAWAGAVDLANEVDDLAAEVENVRYANGEQCLTLANGARYRITAATRGAGRGLSVDLLILDELREHRSWDAWSALSKTTTARPEALIVGISNAGDDQSVVLNSLRSTALAGTDETLGLFEWSAPDGCELDDVQAWAQANPGLGITVSEAAIRSAMMTDPPAVFRTESLCQRVDALDAAIDLASWKAGADASGSLATVRTRVAACVDVAPDGAHVTLAGAAVLDDGKLRVEILAAWSSTAAARRQLAPLLAKVKPAAVGWFPSGPAAELGVDLRALDGLELKGTEATEACQEFAGLVVARQILHPDDPLLNAHVAGTSKLRTGDGWRFTRKGVGHVDAAYAAAGAVRIARTLPPPPARRTRAVAF